MRPGKRVPSLRVAYSFRTYLSLMVYQGTRHCSSHVNQLYSIEYALTLMLAKRTKIRKEGLRRISIEFQIENHKPDTRRKERTTHINNTQEKEDDWLFPNA